MPRINTSIAGIDVKVSVEAPFQIQGLRGGVSTKLAAAGDKSAQQFLSKVFKEMSPDLIKAGRRDALSIKERARGNALGRGRGRGKLKAHKPLARQENFKIRAGSASKITKNLETAKRRVGSGGIFEVEFRPPNKLVRWMGNLLEGNPQGDITSKTYAKSIPVQVVKPKRKKHLLIPVGHFQRSGQPTSMLADLMDNYDRNTSRRYTRLTKGRNFLTNRPAIRGGFRFLLMGPGTKIGKNLPVKGLYIVAPRRRGERKAQIALAYMLKKSVKIQPRGWFSLAFNEWFLGIGGKRTFESFSDDVGDIASKALVRTWNSNKTEKRAT